MTQRPLELAKVWTPHPGPQTQFLHATEYEVLYGGAAGGGKTDALLYLPLQQMHRPSMRALFLRRTFPELRECMDRALATFRQLGAEWSASEKRWRWPSGATYEFGYCETYADVTRYQGQEYGVICYDELGQLAEERVWTFLISRNRSTDPHVQKLMRASANPGGAGHAWLKRRFVDADSSDRRYIPAKLSDNPALDLSDPGYRARLEMLPDVTRRQLMDGDWTAGDGTALGELQRTIHLIPTMPVPDRWYHWGAFDWGYAHPFVAGWFAADDDGTAYLVDSVFGRGKIDSDIAQSIKDRLPVHLFRKFVAGHDCWNEVKARVENTPTTYDTFSKAGILLQRANIDRRSGLRNMREYVHHDATRGIRSKFYIMDTPSNRRVFETLESLVVDPDEPDKPLKVDAGQDGTGGDDAADMVRYGLAARPLLGQAAPEPDLRAWSPEALRADVEKRRIFQHRKKVRKLRPTPDDLI